MSDFGTEATPAPNGISSLSIQASALVRSIDSLSRIFWISLFGTFLTVFFAGLSQLEANAAADYLFLGEYQIPKSILPLTGVMFAVFVLWLTANRLRMLAFVLDRTGLADNTVDEIFFLNPPVLHVFDRDNVNTWSPLTGVGVLIINWAVFLGNSIALTFSSALQRSASFAEFDWLQLTVYLVLILAVMFFGIRAVFQPLQRIISRLHGTDFRVGWPRTIGGILVVLAVVIANNFDQIATPGEQTNDLLGPGFANAVDGETLFMDGVEIKLFGIDAVEPDQVCQTALGADYKCGRAAALALQAFVQTRDVLCLPLFAVNATKVVGVCAVLEPGAPVHDDDDAFLEVYRDNNLSRWLVESGNAIGVGVGGEIFAEEQQRAQSLRVGIWQGSFEPPPTWRARHSKR